MNHYAAGILTCLSISIPALILGKLFPLIGGPVIAILFGMALSPLFKKNAAIRPGIAFTSKKILQYAVVLLGFGMNLSVILEKGRQSLPIIICTIATSLLIAALLYRLLKLPTKSAILIGVGSSICGGSAIAATAPVIDADDEEIAQSISVIFLFNIAAALFFPALGAALGLSNEGFGLFAGTAINDTSSVTAAATAWDGSHGSNTLETATIVKLTRTLAILPITFCLAVYRAKKEQGSTGKSVSIIKSFPYFILFFLAASIAATVIPIPQALIGWLKDLSKFFIIMAMAAIGLNTNLASLIRTGMKPILLGLSCWIGITLVSLLLQSFLGLW